MFLEGLVPLAIGIGVGIGIVLENSLNSNFVSSIFIRLSINLFYYYLFYYKKTFLSMFFLVYNSGDKQKPPSLGRVLGSFQLEHNVVV